MKKRNFLTNNLKILNQHFQFLLKKLIKNKTIEIIINISLKFGLILILISSKYPIKNKLKATKK